MGYRGGRDGGRKRARGNDGGGRGGGGRGGRGGHGGGELPFEDPARYVTPGMLQNPWAELERAAGLPATVVAMKTLAVGQRAAAAAAANAATAGAAAPAPASPLPQQKEEDAAELDEDDGRVMPSGEEASEEEGARAAPEAPEAAAAAAAAGAAAPAPRRKLALPRPRNEI